MVFEIKIPSPGESVSEVEISRWLAPDGSQVSKGQEIAEVESDKATLTIVADVSGKLTVMVGEGQTVAVGTVVAFIDTASAGTGPVVPVAGDVVAQGVQPRKTDNRHQGIF